MFTFSPAVSFVARCETQAELDRTWEKLGAGGEEQQCGWLKDRFGVSWQVIPRALLALIGGTDGAASQRAVTAMMGMKKLDLAALERAYKGV